MIGTAVAAVVLALCRHLVGLGIAFSPLAVGVGMVVVQLSEDPSRPRRRATAIFLGALGTALGLELAAAALAYHTIGEIDMAIVWLMAGWLNLPAAILYAFGLRRLAIGSLALVALLIVSPQVYLGVRWARVHAEALAIIDYLESVEDRSGRYPADLSGYRFHRPSVARLVHYTAPGASGEYSIAYNVGTWTTAHSYSPADGWFYYPD